MWWADDYTGMTQWRMRFPLVILRMISFNMDRCVRVVWCVRCGVVCAGCAVRCGACGSVYVSKCVDENYGRWAWRVVNCGHRCFSVALAMAMLPMSMTQSPTVLVPYPFRYWAANAQRAAVVSGDRGAIAAASGFKSAESRMQRMHQPLRYYESYAWYTSYLLYPPLYIAGPTITYNSFIACTY